MKNKSFLTIEDLLSFFDSHKIYNFSSKEAGKKIIVKSIQDFSSHFEVEEENSKLFAKVKVCHTLLNRNGSYIPEDAMTKAMPSLKYSPLLAYIHQLDDGTWDFHSHDFHVEENDDGEEEIVYDEHQVGTFTNDDPYLQYDKEMDKTYVIAKVVIPVEYTKTAEIIQAKGETKVSCEIAVNSCTYDAKNKYLVIDDFEFLGCALLGSEKDGSEIGEGMLGSKLTLEDFSVDNNSMFAKIDELQARLERLESACSHIQFSEEGGNQKEMKFEELLKKYNKSIEDIDFDYKNMSDEELENKFAELFDDEPSEEEPGETGGNQENGGSQETGGNQEAGGNENGGSETGGNESGGSESGGSGTNGSESGGSGTNGNESGGSGGNGNTGNGGGNSGSGNTEGETDPTPVIDDDEQEKNRKFTVNDGIREFSLSLNEKISAIGELVNATYAEVDNTYYFVTAYDNYVIMEDWWNGRYYKQTYSENDGTFLLTGDRVPVYVEYVTEAEMASLDEMRSNYASIKEELNKYKYAEEYADKMTVFDDASYSDYLDTDEFKNIMKKEFVDQYSKEELSEKADAALGKLVKISKKFSFATKKPESKVNSIKVPVKDNAEEKKPYGNLFD